MMLASGRVVNVMGKGGAADGRVIKRNGHAMGKGGAADAHDAGFRPGSQTQWAQAGRLMLMMLAFRPGSQT